MVGRGEERAPGGWPLLRHAPARLLRSGSTAAMILVSVALLAGLVAAGPLFGATTDFGGLARRLAAIPTTASPSDRPVVRVTVYDGPRADVGPKLEALVNGVPNLGDPVTGVFADAWQLDRRHPAPYVRVGRTMLPAVLFSRTGAEKALSVVRGTPGTPGIWLPEGTARDLGVGPGGRIEVGKSYREVIPGCGSPFVHQEPSGRTPPDTRTTLRVAGTYATASDGALPRGAYFSRLGTDLPSDPGHCPSTGLMLVGDATTVQQALGTLREKPLWTYTKTLTADGRQPQRLAESAAAAAAIRLQSSQPGTPVAKLVDNGSLGTRIDSGLPAIHQQAVADARTAAAQGRGIAYAGAVLGLAAVVMALRALAQRRRRETEMLIGLGTPTRVVVGAGALELLLPTVVGAAIGWAVACLAFGRFGPQPHLEPSAIRAAALAAGAVVLVALVADAVVTAGQAHSVARSLTGRAPTRLGSQWLPVLTGATVLAVVAAFTADDSASQPFSALLPILVLACGCSLVVRAVTAASSAVRRRRGRGEPASSASSTSRSGPDRLVLRGLRRTGVAVADLVIVLSVGVGVLAYGLLAAVQVTRSVGDKAAVLAGAESTAHIAHSWTLGGGGGASPRLPAGTAVLWRATGVMSPDGDVYDVMAVDPTSLRDVADWGSGPELAAARAALPLVAGRGSALNALIVGPSDRAAGTTAEIKVGFTTAPIAVRRTLEAFPGATKPTVVVDARTWFPRLSATDDPSRDIRENLDYQGNFATWVWSRQPLGALTGYLDQKAVLPSDTLTLTEARATPVLTSSRWAAAYQVVLGLAAAALAGLAIVVAVDRRVARAAPVDLVLRRFGFSRGRLLRLRAGELAVTGLAALAVLVLPFALMTFLLPRLVEPAAAVPPGLGVRLPVLPVLAGLVFVVAVTLVATVVAARRSATLPPGEVLRDDG